jgi:uncharacterized surface protein with fasciclin (FAS1) repeats
MPSKRKTTRKKRTKANTGATERAKKTLRKKQAKPLKKAARKKQSTKKASSKASPSRKRKAPVRRAQRFETSGRQAAVSARQSADFEGLSRVEQADSESVDELVEEGNVIEAGAVAGVEEADDEDTREVHTREFPEDDVPGEYLDKD